MTQATASATRIVHGRPNRCTSRGVTSAAHSNPAAATASASPMPGRPARSGPMSVNA